jgi:hypothetical protein
MMRMSQIERDTEVQVSLSRALQSFVVQVDREEDVLNYSDTRNTSTGGIKVSVYNMSGLSDSHRHTYEYNDM